MRAIRVGSGVVVLALLAGVGRDAHAQWVTSVSWKVQNREVGVTYHGPVVERTTGCDADNWSNTVDWGQGGRHQPTSSTAVGCSCNGAPCVPHGTNTFKDETHVYASPGTYTATWYATTHCYGTAGTDADHPFASTIAVYDRIATFKVVITAPAPPSGTTVDLTTTPKTLFDGVDGTTRVVVPPNSTSVDFTYTVTKPSPTKTGSVTASTVGTPRVVKFGITP